MCNKTTKMTHTKKKKRMWIALLLIGLVVIGVSLFIHQASFGHTPTGARLERVLQSPNYRSGKFRNLSVTPQLTGDKGFVGILMGFLFSKTERLTPKNGIPSMKTDLLSLSKSDDVLVWFGHSSYYIQIDGKSMLVDPVFSPAASPFKFINKAFRGTNRYKADDIPPVDFLVITHDHWDHLDYPTVMQLKPKVRRIICPLGVGEHLEGWGFGTDNIVEPDWNDEAPLGEGFEIFCLPARHFSGRGPKPNQSLWASFLMRTPTFSIYIGGDGGYDTHFAAIGERFGGVDLAVLENGQYNNDWKYIHMMPEQAYQAAKDLKAKRLFPVHSSKFAQARHPWDEPLKRIAALQDSTGIPLMTPMIGQRVNLKDSIQTFDAWWVGIE